MEAWYEVSFPVINNLGTPSSKLQINFGVLQIETKNSATGPLNIGLKFTTCHQEKVSVKSMIFIYYFKKAP